MMAQQTKHGRKDGTDVKAIKDGHGQSPGNAQLVKPLTDDDRAVLSLRCLLYDICNQHGGGHGGSAIGMAAIGVALWKHTMRYNPLNPEWFDRDRFVLSNGEHSFPMGLYLVGYPNWTLDELKGYASPKEDGYETICHGHPERQIPGVEVTTGPLGQGIANAVGLAIASKNLATKFNKPSLEVVQSRIYCMTGDGCLMEGIALEAISLAGSLGLDNLVLIYDNNAVTCDGPLEWINTEDVNAKFRASGWHVLDVLDGNHDVADIATALDEAKSLRGKPTMINIRTVIGLGTKAAGTFKAHHGAIDAESIRSAKLLAGQDPSTTHMVPESVLAYFRERVVHGKKLEEQWNDLVAEHGRQFPELAAEFHQRRFDEGSRDNGLVLLRDLDSGQLAKMAMRESNGEILSQLWRACGSLFGGGADLINSCKFSYTDDDVFHPSRGFSGRYVRYGIREHAMAGISNGIAAYSPGTFLPVTATFFMFYLYVSYPDTVSFFPSSQAPDVDDSLL
ncbi:transketolase, thiamine diphosphate binding domain-containing protein [Sarocladium implicatum]|nr:transketolase, thiamine diphosphate binding domain-containing protein [Sarocladium implicatum]